MAIDAVSRRHWHASKAKSTLTQMKDALTIALVVVLSWIASAVHGFGAAPPTRRHYHDGVPQHSSSCVSVSSINMPLPFQNTPQDRIRTLLDEAVLLYQVTMMERLPSQDDAERLVCDVSTAMYAALEPATTDELVILDDISQQIDELVMEVAQLPDIPIKRMEALALEYCEVSKALMHQSTVDADLVEKLEMRLRDLTQLVNVHRMIPLLLEEEMDKNKVLSETPSCVIQAQVAETIPLSSVEPLLTIESQALASSLGSDLEVTSKRYVTTLFASSDSSPSSSDDGRESEHTLMSSSILDEDSESEIDTTNNNEVDNVDIAIVGAGIGGLCAGAILNSLYNKRVGIYESHYLPGGCAHAFDRRASNGADFTFDSGPTILLGCSAPPYNPLRQILNAIGQEVKWISYDAWGMIENPGRDTEKRWRLELGPDAFEQGPLLEFGGEEAQQEFRELRRLTKGLVAGAVDIPAMAMRPGSSALIPLLRYLPALVGLLQQGELSTGTFAPYMDGPIFTVKNEWFRSWLDALAFSLSGLPALRTSAAAMAYVLYDMHRSGAALDYPAGGLGSVIDALVSGVEHGDNGSKVNLRRHVECIDTTRDGKRATGLTLRGGKKVIARDGVICNAPVWSLNNLIKNDNAQRILDNFLPPHSKRQPRQSWQYNDKTDNYILTKRESFTREDSLLFKTDTAEQTGSFLHLHLAIKADGLDLSEMEAHYTVMDRSLSGNGPEDGPCGELNMIAVSNPCVIDKSFAPEGYIVLHAYGAGNEPYELWKNAKRSSPEYKKLKQERAGVLWRAIESVIPDVRDRVVLELVGSPKTHERFLRRPNGTYGAATEDYLKDGSTPIESLVLAGDGIFPGIGVPAVALNGASSANSFVSPLTQWKCLDKLKRKRLIN